jgi:hypothetical protein
MRHHPPRPRRRPAGFAPRVEILEDRRVPTCTAVQSGTTLTIDGTARSDTIQIGDSGTGNISLLCDGDMTPRLFSGVVQVNVHTRAGNDLVHYDLLGSISSLDALNVNFGSGPHQTDHFVAFLNGKTLFTGANYTIGVSGGRGSDNLSVNTGLDPNRTLVTTLSQGLVIPPFVAFQPGSTNFGSAPVVNIEQNAVMRLNLAGGRGKNHIVVNYEGTIAGNGGAVANPFAPTLNPGALLVALAGGPHNDVLITQILADADSGGRVGASEQGAPGDDALTLTVRQKRSTSVQQTQAIAVDARIDGGAGRHNSCDRTPNVLAFNCQSDVIEPAFLPNGEFSPPFPPPRVTQPGGPITPF